MLFSRKDLLAITIVIDIAIHSRDRWATSNEIARRHHLPRRYIEPLLQTLTNRKILAGSRGLGGGYRLARDASLIQADHIVRAVRGPGKVVRGREVQSRISERVVIPVLRKAETAFSKALQRVTVQQLIRSTEKL